MAIELPESIIISKQMNNELKGKKIVSALLTDNEKLFKDGFVNLMPDEFSKTLIGNHITEVFSNGKWIHINIELDLVLLLTIETSGKILYHKNEELLPKKYNIDLGLDDKSHLSVHIIGWGFAKVIKQGKIETEIYPGKLGLIPTNEKDFTYKKFNDLISNFNSSLKSFFVTQRNIAGIGNGYLQDVLFKSKLHPKRKGNNLSNIEKENLFNSIKNIMSEAIRLKGRITECDIYNNVGAYVPILSKDTNNKPCIECGTIITKQNISGSASYICPKCQEL